MKDRKVYISKPPILDALKGIESNISALERAGITPTTKVIRVNAPPKKNTPAFIPQLPPSPTIPIVTRSGTLPPVSMGSSTSAPLPPSMSTPFGNFFFNNDGPFTFSYPMIAGGLIIIGAIDWDSSLHSIDIDDSGALSNLTIVYEGQLAEGYIRIWSANWTGDVDASFVFTGNNTSDWWFISTANGAAVSDPLVPDTTEIVNIQVANFFSDDDGRLTTLNNDISGEVTNFLILGTWFNIATIGHPGQSQYHFFFGGDTNPPGESGQGFEMDYDSNPLLTGFGTLNGFFYSGFTAGSLVSSFWGYANQALHSDIGKPSTVDYSFYAANGDVPGNEDILPYGFNAVSIIFNRIHEIPWPEYPVQFTAPLGSTIENGDLAILVFDRFLPEGIRSFSHPGLGSLTSLGSATLDFEYVSIYSSIVTDANALLDGVSTGILTLTDDSDYGGANISLYTIRNGLAISNSIIGVQESDNPSIEVEIPDGSIGLALAIGGDISSNVIGISWDPTVGRSETFFSRSQSQWIEGPANNVTWNLNSVEQGLFAVFVIVRLPIVDDLEGNSFYHPLEVNSGTFHHEVESFRLSSENYQDYFATFGYHSLWIAFQPPAGSYTIDVSGSNYSPYIEVYTGDTFFNLVFVDSNSPTLTISCDGDTVYRILIYSLTATEYGNLDVSIS